MNQPRTARDRLDRALSIARRTRRFVWPALALLLVGVGGSASYALLRPRVYRSETLILCRGAVRSSDVADGASLSRTRLEQIIKEHRLYLTIIDQHGMVDAVEEMRKHIGFRVQDGGTFALSFEGSDPERVQAVTAKLADALVGASTHGEGDGEPAEVTRLVLAREKDRIEKELKATETARAEFLSKHPEFARESALPGARPAAPPPRATSAPRPVPTAKNDPTLASLERETARLQERLDMPVTNKRKDVPQADPQLVAAKQEAEAGVQQAQRELADKQSQFTEEHPDVRAARVKLNEAQEKLKRASDAVAFSLAAQQQKSAAQQEDEGYIDRGALENQLKRINDEITEYKKRKASAVTAPPPTVVTSSVLALENDWVRLNRELSGARERLSSLQDEERQAEEAESAAAAAAPARTPQLVVIDPAFVPTHSAPPARATIVVVGSAATLALSLLLALGLALLDDRIYDREDIERMGMLPLIGVVPRPDPNADQVKHG